MREQGWQVRSIIRTPRPRVVQKRTQTHQANQRWMIDATSAWCAKEGWVGIMAVIDCCTREIVGFHVGLRRQNKPWSKPA